MRFDLIGKEMSNDDQSSEVQKTVFRPDNRGRRSEFSLISATNQEPIRERREQMVKASLIAAVGLICAAMLAIGFGFVVPVNSAVGDVFDVLAVVSGVFFVGLLDGE
jgi:hypothetical protein